MAQPQRASLGKQSTTTKTKDTACFLLGGGEEGTPPKTPQPSGTLRHVYLQMALRGS